MSFNQLVAEVMQSWTKVMIMKLLILSKTFIILNSFYFRLSLSVD